MGLTSLTDWYAANARELPWRLPDAAPWGVLVSEVMLQQTPVSRVEPAWRSWLTRWPTPAALAAEPVGEAIRAWGRLGYPRRAMRLHAAAVEICAHHDGQVPSDPLLLRRLPGVGDYTAAAVAAFGFDLPAPVLDTNVRRVLARWLEGRNAPTGTAPTQRERAAAQQLLYAAGADRIRPGRLAVSLMELGALVCTARIPRCQDCPLASECEWLAAGRPGLGQAGRGQTYAGTDRQVRGLLLAVLRDSDEPVRAERLDAVWADSEQRMRALDSLLADGLAVGGADGRYRLPG